jgi:putative sigma-54 modulation protein
MSEATRIYVEEALVGLEKYFDRIHDSRLILAREKDRWRSECVVSVSGKTLTAEAEEDLLFTAVDDSVGKLQRQLKKYKAKLLHEKDRRELQQQNASAATESRG